VCLAVAAEYLEVDRKTLNKLLGAGLLPFLDLGRTRRIAVSDIIAFENRQRRIGGAESGARVTSSV
jgi:excisionase family DNA binding protein